MDLYGVHVCLFSTRGFIKVWFTSWSFSRQIVLSNNTLLLVDEVGLCYPFYLFDVGVKMKVVVSRSSFVSENRNGGGVRGYPPQSFFILCPESKTTHHYLREEGEAPQSSVPLTLEGGGWILTRVIDSCLLSLLLFTWTYTLLSSMGDTYFYFSCQNFLFTCLGVPGYPTIVF